MARSSRTAWRFSVPVIASHISQSPFPPVSRYASNQDVAYFFASHGTEVTEVRREGSLRHLRVRGQPLTLPMPASPEECLRIVREFAAQLETEDSPPPTPPK